MRKRSVDIPAYIAEGCGKINEADLARSLSAAFAFASRLEYYALMAYDLQMLSEPGCSQYQPKIIEVKKMLSDYNTRLAAGA